jgi:hypothetical protein
MLARNILLGLILVIFVSAMAFADGGFYGSVTYKNCDCYWNGDKVIIKPLEGQCDPGYCWVDCWGPGYSTQGADPETYPPGLYDLTVEISEQSNCYYGVTVRVYHGEDWQEVNLVVKGPESTPWGGDE